MGITNGQPVDEQFTNPAFVDRRQDDTMFGVYTMQNTTVGANSGATVVNPQKHLNDLMQDRKLFIATATNQKVSFIAGQLVCPEDLLIVSKDFGFTNTIAAASFPISLSDGESVYVNLSRYANATLAPIVTSALPKGISVFRLCTRFGSGLVFWDNSILMQGGSARLGQAGGGVSSLDVSGSGGVPLEGDIELVPGANVSMVKGAGTITINAAGGSGGGGVTYDESQGNVDITLKPIINDPIILQSPDLNQWLVSVDNDGNISVTDGAAGAPSSLKFTKPDLSGELIWTVSNLGELGTDSPAGGELLADSYFIESPNGEAWRVGVANDGSNLVETDTTESNHFNVQGDTDQSLFRVQEVNGFALLYANVFTAATLPASPMSIAGSLPFCFYDNGSAKRMIYHDGTNWRYVHDNSLV